MEHFISRADALWAGVHLLIEVYDADFLDDQEYVRKTLLKAARDIGATVLGDMFYEFPGGGVTGVVALAESHISVHTWPETRYAAIDIFTCGKCDPHDGLPIIARRLNTGQLIVKEELRGRQNVASFSERNTSETCLGS